MACGGSDTETETTEPETTTETTTGSETAAAWSPSGCTTYGFTPEGCEGSPENPNCHSQFTLRPDGTGDILFDDIMARASYAVSGDQVTVSAPDHVYEEAYTLVDGGAGLVDSRGNRYEASPCQ